MWTITENQQTAFSNSMRNEFERRACFAIAKEYTDLSESEISQIVHRQFEKLSPYGIGKEETMMQFMRLSFEYPMLQKDVLPEDFSETLLADEDSVVKIEKLINQLKEE